MSLEYGFLKGDLIEFNDALWRIVEISNDKCLLVQMNENKGKFEIYSIDVLDDILDGDAAGIVTIEQCENMHYFNSADGTDGEKNIRNMQMCEYIKAYDNDLLWIADCGLRSKFIKNMSKEFGVGEQTCRLFLRRFLQNNLNSNKMYSNYHNCGGKGKTRKMLKKKEHQTGIPIDDEVTNQIKKMVKRFKNSKTKSVHALYIDFLEIYYSDKQKVNGEVISKIFDEDKKPTERQFRYHFKKYCTDYEKYIARYGKRAARNNKRALYSDVINDLEEKTIGVRYEMDEMETDFYLVSRKNSSLIVGRAILYLIVDVYSRMITGFTLGFNNNSWAGAEMALFNMVENKKEVCERAGVYIDESQWPVSGVIPKQIHVDNGAEYLSDAFINAMTANDISISYAPPAMGSYKSIVEQIFNQFNKHVKGKVPGEIIFGDSDRTHIKGRHINVEDFQKVVLNFIVYHNNTPLINEPWDNSVFDTEKPLSPVDVWNKKLQGNYALRKIDNLNEYKLSLMKKDKARITKNGIVFKKAIYFCEDMEWLDYMMCQSTLGGTKTIDIFYDVRNMNTIYMKREKEIIRGYLSEKKTINDMYKDCTYGEMEALNIAKNKKLKEAKKIREGKEVIFASQVNNVIKNSSKDGRNYKNIKENRAIEKEELNKEAQLYIEKESTVLKEPNKIDISKLSVAERNKYLEKIAYEKTMKGYME